MKNIKLLLAALLFCTAALAQSPAGTKPLPKEEEQLKDSITAGGLDAYLKGLKDDDGDTKNNTDIEKNLVLIFADSKNDFKKYIGASYGAETFGLQKFEYGLTLGGEEKMYKYYDEHDLLGFNALFKTEDQLAKAVTIKAALESLSKELINKYNYTQKQKGDLITVINTDALNVYDYKVVNNKLTELNIYSSGAGQLARNKEPKKQNTDLDAVYKTMRSVALIGLKLRYTFMLNSIGEKYDYEFIGGDAINLVNFKWGTNLDNELALSWNAVENATKYMDFYKIITTQSNNRTLDKECAIILSDVNFKEIKSKGETKMDFGNGMETFKFIGDGKINVLYKRTFKTKKDIVLANDSKTIFIAVLDYDIFPLITKIKTPTQLLDLSSMSYK